MKTKKEEAMEQPLIPMYKIWLETSNGEGVLGDGKWLLLKTIQKKGSLMAATEELGISYRNTWNRLKKIEKQLGYSLIEKKRGGKDGGQSILTEKGIKLVQSFDKFHKNFDIMVTAAFKNFIKDLKNL
jgi:molybdate transport repressor ModE-like protein